MDEPIGLFDYVVRSHCQLGAVFGGDESAIFAVEAAQSGRH